MTARRDCQIRSKAIDAQQMNRAEVKYFNVGFHTRLIIYLSVLLIARFSFASTDRRSKSPNYRGLKISKLN